MKKKISKTLLSLLLILAMVPGFATTAFAAGASIDFQGFSEGFDFQPGSEYTETDLFDNFKNVMPGDVVQEKITFTNSAKDCDFINLYMRAEAHDENGNPLSPKVAETGETPVTMADFLARLSMKVWNGTELIYDASPDELDGLRENKFLGTFRSGDTTTLTVELTVPLELSNEYANRVGEVDWVFHVEAYNESQLTVRKVWSDGNSNHVKDSVTVNLLKDGKFDRSIELNADNQWIYTFDKLLEGYKWSVEEADVPEGYEVSYDTTGTMTTITNRLIPPPFHGTSLSVDKVWENAGSNRPDSVTVDLLRNGKYYDSVTLSDRNDWSYTWDNLNDEYSWTAVESDVPEGYDVSYKVKGNHITIINTKEKASSNPIDLGVKKVWDDNGKDRPDYVTVTLYNGNASIETVRLGEWNDWSYTWKNLPSGGNWSIAEVNIPKGYTPSYTVNNGIVTIKNTATLIQTGQLNWPIIVLGGLGLVFISLGLIMIFKKKKDKAV